MEEYQWFMIGAGLIGLPTIGYGAYIFGKEILENYRIDKKIRREKEIERQVNKIKAEKEILLLKKHFGEGLATLIYKI